WPCLVRRATLDWYSCPLGQTHHASMVDPQCTAAGIRPAFFSGCHWRAIAVSKLARSFTPAITVKPRHTEHPPPPFATLPTGAAHWCRGSLGQTHQTTVRDPAVTSVGDTVFF